jgi:hypothetical protein
MSKYYERRTTSMNLKNFDEFTKSLTKEDLDYINGVDNAGSFSGNISSNDGFTEFLGFLGGAHFGMSLRLLECYHEWLEKQLSDQ